MAATTTNVPVNSLLKQLTMTIAITGLPALKVRLWLAGWLFYLAAWILQCGIKIDTEKLKPDVGTWGDEIGRIQERLKTYK